jgi:hypothetical protein
MSNAAELPGFAGSVEASERREVHFARGLALSYCPANQMATDAALAILTRIGRFPIRDKRHRFHTLVYRVVGLLQ